MIIEPLNDEMEWDSYLDNSSRGTAFHSLKWKKIIDKSFGFESSYFVIRNDCGELLGICPFYITNKLYPIKILDSLPNSDMGGPLLNDPLDGTAAMALRNHIKEIGSRKGLTYARLNLMDNELCFKLKESDSRVDTSSGIMTLDLDDKPIESIWNNQFNHKIKQYINRFERDGFSTRLGKNMDDMYKFINLYKSNMSKAGFDCNSAFFLNMFEILYPENLNIILIEKDQTCIGAGLSLVYKNKNGKNLYMVGVGLDKSISSRYKIYYKLRWETIKYASEIKCKSISLGPTLFDENEIHHRMKAKFGAEFKQCYILYIPLNKNLFALRESSLALGRIFRDKMPLKIKNQIFNRL